MARQNCWEYKKCGREPGGSKIKEFGICPAATDKKFDGVHDGINGGRACWIIAKTLCGGSEQGTFQQKWQNCNSCDFYKLVGEEQEKVFG